MSDRRANNPADPTAERTAEQTTQSAGGLSGGRPGLEKTRLNDDNDDVIGRSGEDDRATPRRSGESETESDPVMPTDDTSLGTKI